MLSSQVESILFVSSKPMRIKELAKLCNRTKDEIEVALESLKDKYNQEGSGINILINQQEIQMVSNPKYSKLVEGLIKEEVISEITQPQLEALTIICYRGPITKLELEQIRAVNCSLILRNLMIKGLVEVEEDKIVDNNKYRASLKLIKHLGINSLEELPDYDRLSKSESLEEVLGGAKDN
jgi:segregation and condensation protein B